jgi:hypothetical protein
LRIDYKPEIEQNLWLWDVRREGNRLVTVGDDWNLGVISGAGDSIDQAVNSMYKSVDGFLFCRRLLPTKIRLPIARLSDIDIESG